VKNLVRALLVAAVAVSPAALAQPITFTHLAGNPGGASFEDGNSSVARFATPLGVAVDSAGNVYVADSKNHTIRRIAPSGDVSTFAGRAGAPGSLDGSGSAARFSSPSGIAVDAHDVVWVADTANHAIRRIGQDRRVTTFAGTLGQNGAQDGTLAAARFQSPLSLAVDAAGALYVADTGNHTIRKVTAAGVVSTLAGLAGAIGHDDGTGTAARFQTPSGVAVDASGNVYVADTNNHTIRKVTPAAAVSTLAGVASNFGNGDGTGVQASFFYPGRVAVDLDGSVLVADTGNNTIRRVTPAGVVTTLYGSPGVLGFANGTGTAARFSSPNGLVVDAAGNLYVADSGNHTVRKIAAGSVATLAGSPLAFGNVDDTGAAARFSSPAGIASDTGANIYVADGGNHTIRKVTSGGAVATIAGVAGIPGSTEGSASSARFRSPQGVAWFGGIVYVADTGNHSIRQIDNKGTVSTFAGLSGTAGTADGKGGLARFNAPRGLAVDGSGNLYVADTGNHAIRKITPSGDVTTFAGKPGVPGSADGTTTARFANPWALTLDAAGNLFVADTGNSTIRRVSTAGVVSTFAGTATLRGSQDDSGVAARFNLPSGIVADANGNLYVADTGNNAVRKVRPGGNVQTVAGLADVPGASTDGTGSDARFNVPRGIALDASGRLAVADSGNDALRRGVPTVQDRAIIDAPGGPVGAQRKLDTAPQTASSWEWAIVRRPSGSTAELSATTVVNPTFTPDEADVWVFRLAATSSSAKTFSTVTLTTCDVPPPQIVRTAGNEPSCAASAVTLDAGAGYVSYKWSTGEETQSITVSPAATTTYTVTAVDAAGCAAPSASYTHQVAASLVSTSIALAAGGAACSGAVGLTAAATETAGGVSAHQWGFRTATGGATTPIPGATGATYTVRFEDFPGPGPYLLVETATPSCGSPAVSNELPIVVSAGTTTRLVPIVLDVVSGSAHFTTQLALTNRGTTDARVSLTYTAALGASPQGSGTASGIVLASGSQLLIPSVLDFLRAKALPIPPSSSAPQQGGTLLVRFDNVPDVSAVAVTARTTSPTSAPQPVGAAGLAYPGLGPCDGSTGSVVVYALRTNAGVDRSNLAVFATDASPVTVMVTVKSGAASKVVRDALTLPGHGWAQISGVLDGTGITNGYAVVERVAGAGGFGAYGVVNDDPTNDGSFLAGLPATATAGTAVTFTLPVLVEIAAPRFDSELVLANAGPAAAVFTLDYTESLSPALGAGGRVVKNLGPGEQLIIPNAIDDLRTNGVHIGPRGAASYAGAVRVSVSSTSVVGPVFAGARVASPSVGGGEFGLFVPPVFADDAAQESAFLYGLVADADHRTNVAVAHAGSASDGDVTLELRAFDGDAHGVQKGAVETVHLAPGGWKQLGNFLKDRGVANGFVGITRVSGSAGWTGYAVVNDGGNPGERTGDGAFGGIVR
jgi:sugar lactone lactonase YvrE